MEELMPGLPDDMARECLVRVPYDYFPTVGSVCKHWKEELLLPSFNQLRRRSGNVQPLILVVQSEPDQGRQGSRPPIYRLALLEPIAGVWRSLPFPRHGGLPLFCRLAPLATELVVVGGWDTSTWAATDEVHVYDFLSASWRRGSPIPGPRRSFFACAASAERQTVFIAGGHDESENALRSAMAYDASRDTWAPLPDMERERHKCQGVVARGRFVVFGGRETEDRSRFSESAEALDLNARSWVHAEEGDGERPAPYIVTSGGQAVYRCTGRQVEIIDGAAGGKWRRAAELPSGVKTVTHVMAWGEKELMVLGLSGGRGGAPVVYVLETTSGWRKVEVPEEFQGRVVDACCMQM